MCGVALLEATGDAIGTKVENIEVKANYDTFMNWLRRAALDEVYIDVPMDSGESFIPYLEEMESMGLTVHFHMPLLDRIEESCCNETSSACAAIWAAALAATWLPWPPLNPSCGTRS